MILLAHLLPAGTEIWDTPETKVSFDDRRIITYSLTRWIATSQPSVLVEHQLAGGSVGRVLLGMERADGYFALIEVPEHTISELVGSLRYVSPRIAWDYRDVYGQVWPAALLEVSLVSVPRFHDQQSLGSTWDQVERKVSEERPHFVMSAINPPSDPPVDDSVDPSTVDHTPPMEFEMNEEMMMQIKEIIKAVLAEMNPSEPAPEVEVEVEESEEEVEEVVEESSEESQMMDLPSVDDLLTMAADARKEALMGYPADRKEAVMMEMIEKMESKGKVEEAVMSAVRQRKVQPRTPSRGPVDPYAEALEMSQRTGKSYSECLRDLRARK